MFRPSYVIIPLLTIIIALIGKNITKACDAWTWYQSLNLPSITPPNYVFPIVWNTIFILTALAVIIVWNTFERNIQFWAIIGLFIANACLNILWTYLFFGNHMIGAALLEAIILEFVTIALMAMIANRSYLVSLLLLPYVIWVGFAIWLNVLIYRAN